MILSWCLSWICFDWKTTKYFVFAAISIGFAATYSLFPVDALPDFIPVAGVIDDLTLNIFGAGLGSASILKYYKASITLAFYIIMPVSIAKALNERLFPQKDEDEKSLWLRLDFKAKLEKQQAGNR